MNDDLEQESFYQTGATNRRQLFEDKDVSIRQKNKQQDDVEITFDGMNFIEETTYRQPNKSINSPCLLPDFSDETGTIKQREYNFEQSDGQVINRAKVNTQSIYHQHQDSPKTQNNSQHNNNQSKLNKVWKQQFFSLFLIVFNVIRFAKMARKKQIPLLFNQLAVELIADKAFDKSVLLSQQNKINKNSNNNNQQKKVLNRKKCKCLVLIKLGNQAIDLITQQFYHLKDKFNLFMIYLDEKLIPWDPLSTFIILWEHFQIVCLTFLFFYIPFRVNVQQIPSCEDIHDYIHLVFVADLVVKMNTQFFYEGEIIKNHQDIFINYFKTSLIPDFLAISVIVFPKLYLFERQEFLFIVFKMNGFLKIIDKTKENITSITKLELFNLFNLIVIDLFIGHFVACEWVALGIWQKKVGRDNWIDLNELNTDTIISLYVKSLYFIIITMNTVGYGDFTPKTDLERIADMVVILVGCMLFGYSISKIGTILQSLNKNREKLTQSMGGVNLYMKSNKLSFDLQNKVRKYLEYIHLKRDERQQSNDFINLLSKNLQREILIKVQGNALKSVDMLMKNFSSQFLEDLSLKVKQIYLAADEAILEEDQQVEDPSFYILNQGCIEISFRNIICAILKDKGEHFGQIEFFSMEKKSLYSIKSVGITSLFQIQLSDFVSLFQQYPAEKEIFYNISHGVKNNQRFHQIVSSCRICCSISHIEQNCTFVQYKPNPFKLAKNLHLTQVRQKGNARYINQKFNTLINQKKIEDALYDTDEDINGEESDVEPTENQLSSQINEGNQNGMINQSNNNNILEDKYEYISSSSESTIKSSDKNLKKKKKQLSFYDLNFDQANHKQGMVVSKAYEIDENKLTSNTKLPTYNDLTSFEKQQVFESKTSMNQKKKIVYQLNKKKSSSISGSASFNEISIKSNESKDDLSYQEEENNDNNNNINHNNNNFNNQINSLLILKSDAAKKKKDNRSSKVSLKSEKLLDLQNNNINGNNSNRQILKSINNLDEKDFQILEMHLNQNLKQDDQIDFGEQSYDQQELRKNEVKEHIQINTHQKVNNKFSQEYLKRASMVNSAEGNLYQYQQLNQDSKMDIHSLKQDILDNKSMNVNQDTKSNKRRQSSFFHLDPTVKPKGNTEGNNSNNNRPSQVDVSLIQSQQNNQLEFQFESLKSQLIQFLSLNTQQNNLRHKKQTVVNEFTNFTTQKTGSNNDIHIEEVYQQKIIGKEDSLLDDIGKDYKYYFPWNNKTRIISVITSQIKTLQSLKPKHKQRMTQKLIKKIKK